MSAAKQRPIHHCQCQQCQRHPYSRVAKDHQAINRVVVGLDEKGRRRFVGVLAVRQPHGGIQLLRQITGLSRTTIGRGRDEIRRVDRTLSIRRAGAGRPAVEKNSQRF